MIVFMVGLCVHFSFYFIIIIINIPLVVILFS